MVSIKRRTAKAIRDVHRIDPKLSAEEYQKELERIMDKHGLKPDFVWGQRSSFIGGKS